MRFALTWQSAACHFPEMGASPGFCCFSMSPVAEGLGQERSLSAWRAGPGGSPLGS